MGSSVNLAACLGADARKKGGEGEKRAKGEKGPGKGACLRVVRGSKKKLEEIPGRNVSEVLPELTSNRQDGAICREEDGNNDIRWRCKHGDHLSPAVEQPSGEGGTVKKKTNK